MKEFCVQFKLKYSSAQLVSLIILLPVTFIFGYIMGIDPNPKQEVVYYPYYTSVAHTEKGDAWELVKEDLETDTAYYIINEPLVQNLQVGDELFFTTGAIGILQEISPNGFTLKVDSSNIWAGLSGSPIYNEREEVVGYVSSAIGNYGIYCIWR